MLKPSRGCALFPMIVLTLACSQSHAEDVSLEQRVTQLEAQVKRLQQLLDEKFADDRWKDGVLWSRIRPGMRDEDVRKLLGKPARVEQAIFTTWYYHKTSKDHSHVWFDEGKVLGWEGLEQKHGKPRRLKP